MTKHLILHLFVTKRGSRPTVSCGAAGDLNGLRVMNGRSNRERLKGLTEIYKSKYWKAVECRDVAFC